MNAYRLPAVLAAFFFSLVPTLAQVSYVVTFNDPNNTLTTQNKIDLTNTIKATGADWSRYLVNNAPVSLSVQLNMTTTVVGAAGGSGSSAYVNTVNNIDIYEQSAAAKLRNGSLAFQPQYDINFYLNPNYMNSQLFFEANPTQRSSAIPQNRLDAYSVFAHEFGHAFAFNGWRSSDGTLNTPANPRQYQSTYDKWMTVENNGDILFRGPNAMAIYGAPVPITNGNVAHIGNAANSGRPGSDLLPDLMNGVVFYYQNRYVVSALDLAIAKDAGMTLAPFRWTNTSGNWADTTKWNLTSDAGPNAILPTGAPFDARIDRTGSTAYSVTLNQSISLNSFTLASADATLSHTAGSFSASIVNLTSGTYRLDGGTISGGVWTGNGGALKTSGQSTNTITNAVLGSNVLDLQAGNSFVRFAGDTSFSSPSSGTTIGTGSVLAVAQSAITQGTIQLNGGTLGIDGNRTLTLGANTTVSVSSNQSSGTLGSYAGSTGTGKLINNGTVDVSGTNSTLTINPLGELVNNSVIRTSTATSRIIINAGGVFTNSGTLNATGNVNGNVLSTAGNFTLQGSISGQLNVTGGTIGTGYQSPGTLTVGSAKLNNGASIRWQIKDWSTSTTAGVHYDQFRSLGSLDLSTLTSSGMTIKIAGLDSSNQIGSVANFDSSVARSWTLAQFANDLSSSNSNLFVLDTTEFAANNNLNGGAFALTLTSTGSIIIAFVPVPEPACLFVLSLSSVYLGLRYRKSRQAKVASVA